MAFEYGISAKLNVDGALKNVEKLLTALDKVDKKASNLKIQVSVNNELAKQLAAIQNLNKAKNDSVQTTKIQQQSEAQLAAAKAKTAAQEQKNAQDARMAEERLATQKAKTAAQEQKNAQDAQMAQQKLAAQRKADAAADAAAAQKKKTLEQQTQTEAARTAQINQKTEDAAKKAAQDRFNAQNKANADLATAAARYYEQASRGEQRVQQEAQRTQQSKIATWSAIIGLIDKADRAQYNAEQRDRRQREQRARDIEKQQKAQRANDDAIARDLEKQARIEQAQAEIQEQNITKNKELRDAIAANQRAQADYNKVLAKALPTVNEIRNAMQRLSLTQENLKLAQYRANSPFGFLMGKFGENGSWAKNLLRAGGGLSKLGELTQGFSQAYQSVQQGAENLVDRVWGVANSFFNRVVNGFQNLTQEGLEAFGTLEMAEIGFKNFFDGSSTEFVRQIKERAVDMPMVGAADLARSVQYIAPLAKGDSQLALGAVEGVMKSIVYSGNDVSQYGTKALQNLTQVASGNLTATDIKEMMRQMPALARLLASTETGGELLEGGQITAKAVKNYIAKYGSDAILGVFKEISEKSEASDIYDVANKTFKGAMEQLREKMVLSWQDAFDNSGAANLFKDLLNEISKDGGIVEQFTERITHYARVIVNWVKLNQEEIKEIADAFGKGLGEIGKTAKDVVGEILQELGVMNGNKLNAAGLKNIIRQVTKFVKDIIKGFGDGVKGLKGIIDMLQKHLGPDIMEKIGRGIGFLVSPMGKLITVLGTFTSNGLRALGGIVDMFGRVARLDTTKKIAEGITLSTGKLFTDGVSTSGVSAPMQVGQTAYYAPTKTSKLANSKLGQGARAVGRFGVRAIKGAGFALLGTTITKTVTGLAEVAGASKEVVSSLNGLGMGVSLAVAGFTMFGPGGAIIGGILGAVTGFVSEMERQKEKLYQENVAKNNKDIEELMSSEGIEAVKEMSDNVFAALEAEGVKIDRGSDSGKYAENMLLKHIDELMFTRDENGKVIRTNKDDVLTALESGELAKVATGWYRDQEVKHATANLTTTETFLRAGGNVIDFEKDTARRDRLAKFIERNWLNGDTSEYDYQGNSAETIVRDYLQTISPNGKQELTDKQYAMLFQEENERSKELAPLLQTAEGVDGLREDLKGLAAWNDVSWVAQKTDEYGLKIWQTLQDIDKQFILLGVKNGVYGQDGVNTAAGNFVNSNTANAIVSWRAKGAGGAFGGQSDDNRYTNPDGSRSYKGFGRDNRDRMAEVYGKRPDDNDDFEETITKMGKVADDITAQIIQNRDNEAKLSELNKDYEILEGKRNELQGLVVGDWGGLFKIQNELADLMRKYGVQFRAFGGSIIGRGVDTVPAFLQPGEFVMRKSSVDKAGVGVFAALNRGDFAGAAHALGSKFNSSWDNSHHWSNSITNNNTSNTSNYFFAGGQVRGRRNPYRSMANRVATI